MGMITRNARWAAPLIYVNHLCKWLVTNRSASYRNEGVGGKTPHAI